MLIEVYTDESRQDLFTSSHADSEFMLLGSLWLPAEKRIEYKAHVKTLKQQFDLGNEFKWKKLAHSNVDFYRGIIDFFLRQGDDLRFRCIAVRASEVDVLRYHNSDAALGFYKFYYQLLHHWILDFNDYAIFCDTKTNRKRDRLKVLKKCLERSNLSSTISTVQALPSDESVLIQVTDVLLGAISSRLNKKLQAGSPKEHVVSHLEEGLGRTLAGTNKAEQKFNVFVIDLSGGW